MTAPPRTPSPRCFTFISSNHSWGGSEELWSAAAAVLAERGHRIRVLKSTLEPSEPRVQKLQSLGCELKDLAGIPCLPNSVFARLKKVARPLTYVVEAVRLLLALWLSQRPDLVVLSQGGNFDGWLQGMVCRRQQLTYALVIQKATDLYWPSDSQRMSLQRMYRDACWSFFVSEHNRRLTQEQLAIALPRSSVVRNPYLVPAAQRTDWPDDRGGVRLACIGRLYLREKGQDLLLRVLARDKWRARPVSVTFYGAGDQRRGLEEMASFLKLTSVHFGGFVRDVSAIWDTHHGLVLPSRCEGLPLVAVETMLSSRVPILTDVGGARELVDDEVSGFVAAAPTEDAVDDALERAWQRRSEWRAIGAVARERARAAVPVDPAATFADLLEQLASQTAPVGVGLEPCVSAD